MALAHIATAPERRVHAPNCVRRPSERPRCEADRAEFSRACGKALRGTTRSLEGRVDEDPDKCFLGTPRYGFQTPPQSTCLRPGEAQCTRCGAELHDQSARVGGRGLEVVGTIEARGVLIHRVDYDEAPAGGARGHDDRGQGMNQQLGTESLAVQILMKGQLGKEDRGDALGRPATDTSRGVITLDQMRGKGVVADDSASSFLYEQICASALPCGMPGVLPQPYGEGVVPAVEGVEVVIGDKRFDAVVHVGLIRLCRPTSLAARVSPGTSSGSSRDATN